MTTSTIAMLQDRFVSPDGSEYRTIGVSREELERVIAEARAEALEGVTAHDISRMAKAAGKDAWEMNPVGIAKEVNALGERYRRQATKA